VDRPSSAVHLEAALPDSVYPSLHSKVQVSPMAPSAAQEVALTPASRLEGAAQVDAVHFPNAGVPEYCEGV